MENKGILTSHDWFFWTRIITKETVLAAIHIEWDIESLGPRVIGPSHCSGRAAQEYLRERFPGTVIDVRAGTRA